MNYRLITSVAGLFLFIPSAMGLLITGYPTTLHPFPAITVLPAFLLASLHLWMVGAVVPVVIFFAWNPGLLRGEPRIPKRSFVLVGLAIIFSIVWFWIGWKYGLEYQGPRYVWVLCIINAVWLLTLGVLFARTWKAQPSFRTNLLLHWLLFAWLAWFAFPYLGELP